MAGVTPCRPKDPDDYVIAMDSTVNADPIEERSPAFLLRKRATNQTVERSKQRMSSRRARSRRSIALTSPPIS